MSIALEFRDKLPLDFLIYNLLQIGLAPDFLTLETVVMFVSFDYLLDQELATSSEKRTILYQASDYEAAVVESFPCQQERKARRDIEMYPRRDEESKGHQDQSEELQQAQQRSRAFVSANHEVTTPGLSLAKEKATLS